MSSSNSLLSPQKPTLYISQCKGTKPDSKLARVVGPYTISEPGVFGHIQFPCTRVEIQFGEGFVRLTAYSRGSPTPVCKLRLPTSDSALRENTSFLEVVCQQTNQSVDIAFRKPPSSITLYQWLTHPDHPYRPTSYIVCNAGSTDASMSALLQDALGTYVDVPDEKAALIMRLVHNPGKVYISRSKSSDGMYVYTLHINGIEIGPAKVPTKNADLAAEGRLNFSHKGATHFIEFSTFPYANIPLFVVDQVCSQSNFSNEEFETLRNALIGGYVCSKGKYNRVNKIGPNGHASEIFCNVSALINPGQISVQDIPHPFGYHEHEFKKSSPEIRFYVQGKCYCACFASHVTSPYLIPGNDTRQAYEVGNPSKSFTILFCRPRCDWSPMYENPRSMTVASFLQTEFKTNYGPTLFGLDALKSGFVSTLANYKKRSKDLDGRTAKPRVYVLADIERHLPNQFETKYGSLLALLDVHYDGWLLEFKQIYGEDRRLTPEEDMWDFLDSELHMQQRRDRRGRALANGKHDWSSSSDEEELEDGELAEEESDDGELAEDHYPHRLKRLRPAEEEP